MADDDVLTADEDTAGESGADHADSTAEYTFEGYTVEFSDLVMLTAVTPK
jgi:hypothetical protein